MYKIFHEMLHIHVLYTLYMYKIYNDKLKLVLR